VDDLVRVAPAQLIRGRSRSDRRGPLARPPSGGPGPCLQGDPPGDAVQPARDRGGLADGGGFAGEGEKGGLEGVLRVGLAGQDGSADAEHHRAVPPQEGGEGELVPPGGEPPEQVVVRDVRQFRAVGDVAESPEEGGCWGGHDPII
jgi:hypothetical protein